MQFIVHMKEIFSTIIALVCHVPFLIPTVFHSLPYLELPKVRTFHMCRTGPEKTCLIYMQILATFLEFEV